jgi:hypothetical protein
MGWGKVPSRRRRLLLWAIIFDLQNATILFLDNKHLTLNRVEQVVEHGIIRGWIVCLLVRSRWTENGPFLKWYPHVRDLLGVFLSRATSRRRRGSVSIAVDVVDFTSDV